MNNLYKDEQGQSVVEYGLILMLVAMAVFVSIQSFGQWTSGLFSDDDLKQVLTVEE